MEELSFIIGLAADAATLLVAAIGLAAKARDWQRRRRQGTPER